MPVPPPHCKVFIYAVRSGLSGRELLVFEREPRRVRGRGAEGERRSGRDAGSRGAWRAAWGIQDSSRARPVVRPAGVGRRGDERISLWADRGSTRTPPLSARPCCARRAPRSSRGSPIRLLRSRPV